MADLNPKALQILEYIRDRLEDGLPPSVREICAALEIKSTSTAHKYLGELQERGLIEKGSRLNRAITLPDDRSIRVPLVGTVTAGQPILAVEEIEGYIPYRSHSLHSRDLFALRVRGDSMINVGILDGDIIIIRQTPTAENGDIVVALFEDEATVKTYRRKDGHIWLMPENPEYQPIDGTYAEIIGKVVAVVRRY